MKNIILDKFDTNIKGINFEALSNFKVEVLMTAEKANGFSEEECYDMFEKFKDLKRLSVKKSDTGTYSLATLIFCVYPSAILHDSKKWKKDKENKIKSMKSSGEPMTRSLCVNR